MSLKSLVGSGLEFARVEALEERRMFSTSTFYNVTNLVSDGSVAGTRTDADLVNAWGLAASDTGPWWVAGNGTGQVPAYDGSGAQAAPTFAVPPARGQTEANPTGIVFNGGKGFAVKSGHTSAPAEYVIATENGTIAGWNSNVDPNNAITEVDNSAGGAVYKGVALAKGKKQTFLYAADFHNARVDVFDSSFKAVTMKAGAFTDTHLPAGYAPFNVANIDGNLYVTYALQDADAHDDVGGPRHGFIDIYNTSGALIKRFASRGSMDSPWAVVAAPESFGKFGGDILVGNFGNGLISAFSRKGKFQGFLTDATGNSLSVPGLWGLAFGNGNASGPTSMLYFAAGPQEESHGLFGSIAAGHKHHTAVASTDPGPGTGPY
jgi:uncharacterized protein (TIGR03118 family)